MEITTNQIYFNFLPDIRIAGEIMTRKIAHNSFSVKPENNKPWPFMEILKHSFSFVRQGSKVMSSPIFFITLLVKISSQTFPKTISHYAHQLCLRTDRPIRIDHVIIHAKKTLRNHNTRFSHYLIRKNFFGLFSWTKTWQNNQTINQW